MKPLRDSLGEAMRTADHYGSASASWDDLPELTRVYWRNKADRLLEAAPQSGVLIVKQPVRDGSQD